jgi:serine/threonine protein phosphatase PrpC
MFIDSVCVQDNGTINGRVCHSILAGKPYKSSGQHIIKTLSGGKGHSKWQTRSVSVGLTGQDVFGNTPQSIFVSDGHGAHGWEVASDLKGLIFDIERNASMEEPVRVEKRIRSVVCDYVEGFRDNSFWQDSGATYTSMTMVESNGRRWVITVNIGDSEAFIAYKDRIHVCSLAHNWDNLSLYRRYCSLVSNPKPVCYNRWNASRFRLEGPSGCRRPILMYSMQNAKPQINKENAVWVSESMGTHGTQSIRISAHLHENWGSSVLVNGRARGQNMATAGDFHQRTATQVPMNMVHVYIHEIPLTETVACCVQSDGISDRMTLRDCAKRVWSGKDEYLRGIKNIRDDISVGIMYSSIRQNSIPYQGPKCISNT